MALQDHCEVVGIQNQVGHGSGVRLIASVVAAIGLVMLLSVPLAVGADPRVRLAVEPIDPSGRFLERTMQAGESAKFTVDLANYGDAAIRARTYPADVYPIINGGFGARLRGEPSTGATLWLDYETDVLEIASGAAVRRTFDVSVPVGTRPGEYITSIIIENDQPLRSGEGMAFNQFVRSALAVAITVPGPMEAVLRLGDARHTFFQGHSVVDVAIDNIGDLRLKPAGSFTVATEAGQQMDIRNVAMDSVYARTSTSLEVMLDRALSPGRYVANVDMRDPERGGSVAGTRPFVVGTDVPTSPSIDPAAFMTDTLQPSPTDQPTGTGAIPVDVGIGLIVSLFGLLGFAAVLRRWGRRRRNSS